MAGENIGNGSVSMMRVAAYCRVSTNEKDQKNSFRAQIDYYTHYIASRPSWVLAGIFADEGISGTQTRRRVGFNEMMALCRRGKIDLVLCKSISRFARNTVDLLDSVRELKSLGIAVIFEKEHINTMASDSEFILSLFASFAQAESESISRNITWGIEKSYREGKVNYHPERSFGYGLDKVGNVCVIEQEAEYVRYIFDNFAAGVSMGQIAKDLTEKGVVRRFGSSVWNRRNVEMILKNEKYAGLVLLQKTYTRDPITHERAGNRGEKPMYLIENAHAPIISRELWDRARQEFSRRSLEHTKQRLVCKRKRRQPYYALGTILKCTFCQSRYRRVIWQSKGVKYAVWRSGRQLEGGKQMCPNSFSIKEKILHEEIVRAVKESGYPYAAEMFDEAVALEAFRVIYVEGRDRIRPVPKRRI